MAEIDSLTISIGANDDGAEKKILSMVGALESMKSVLSGGISGLKPIGTGLSAIASGANAIQPDAATKVKAMAEALQGLRGLEGVKLSTTIGTQLASVANAVSNIQWTDGDKIEALANGLRPLTELGKANLNTFIKQLGKLPALMKELDKADMGKFAQQMKEVASAIQPLANEMNKVAAGFSAFPIRIQKIIQSNAGLAASNTKAAKSFGVLGKGISRTTLRFGAYALVFRRIASAIGGWLAKSNAYVENLNLFNVAMGEYAESAKEYAETVGEVMGIDPSQWMRNQGIFMTLATGFGVAADKAALMSKNLTQLGYDLSSFFNIDVEEAMQKLQSGISGELEPLRRLGYDLSQARLEAIALANGIEQSVSSMNQAQKAQLRYYAIMTQVTKAQGDMARTLEAPANQLRILQAQLSQTERALGNIFIPMLNAVLPYLIAFIQLAREAANALAALFGFKLPEVDYSGLDNITTGAEEAEAALGGASGAAEELKGSLAGFDEITLITQTETGGGGGGASDVLGGDLGLDLKGYDFLGDALESRLDEVKEKLKELLKLAADVGAALLAWKIASALVPDLGLLSKLLGALMVGVGLYLLIDAIEDIIANKKLTWANVLKGGAGGSIAGGGLGLMLAKKWGLTWKQGLLQGAGIGLGLSLMIMGITEMVVSGSIDLDNVLTTAIGSLVAGGSLGYGLTKFGFFAGEGIVIGASVALSLTLTSINFAAISSGQWESGDWQSVVMGALSTVAAGVGGYVLAGALLGSAAGPVGAVIGVGVGLLINIISASIAEDQARQLMVQNTFYDEQGVLIADLADHYNNLMQKITNAQAPIISAWEAIGSSKESIEGTTQNIDNLATQVDLGYKDIQETMPLIKSEFDALYEDTKSVLEQEAELIYTALAGSAGEALADMGIALEEAGLLIASTVNATTVELEKLKAQNDELYESIQQGTADEGAMSQYLANAKEIASLSGVDTSALDEFRNKVSNLIPEDINWKTDDLTSVFDGIAASTNEAKTAIEESSAATLEALEHMKSLAVSPEDVQLFDSIISAFTADRDTKIAEIESLASEFVGGLQTNLITSVEDQVNTAMEEWDSMSWITKMFKYGNNQAKYVQSALNDYNATVVEPLTSQMKEAFSDALSEDDLWAQDAMKSLIDTMFDTTMGAGAGMSIQRVTSFASDVTSAIDKVLPAQMKEAGINAGGSIIDGQAQAITDNTQLVVDAATKSAETTIEAYDIALEAHSPSKVMEDRGLWIDQGLANGITDNTSLVTSAMDGMLDGMLSTMEGFADEARKVFEDMLDDIQRSMNSIDVSASGKLSYSGSTRGIKAFASGGFPQHGQMFLARESGPELVGTIGGQTAVANNDQIVEGIAAGVASAQSEQNALLRQQNELLMALLDKEWSFGEPSASFGRFASRSMERYAALSGR